MGTDLLRLVLHLFIQTFADEVVLPCMSKVFGANKHGEPATFTKMKLETGKLEVSAFVHILLSCSLDHCGRNQPSALQELLRCLLIR